MKRSLRIVAACNFDYHTLARHIAADLRPEDAKEFAAAGCEDDVGAITGALLNSSNAMVVEFGRTPVFVFGTVRVGRGQHHIFGFGTPQAKRTFPFITKYVKETWLPDQFKYSGCRRIEARIPVSSVHSFEWLVEHIGATVEGVVHGVAVTGEPMFQLAYTENNNVLIPSLFVPVVSPTVGGTPSSDRAYSSSRQVQCASPD